MLSLMTARGDTTPWSGGVVSVSFTSAGTNPLSQTQPAFVAAFTAACLYRFWATRRSFATFLSSEPSSIGNDPDTDVIDSSCIAFTDDSGVASASRGPRCRCPLSPRDCAMRTSAPSMMAQAGKCRSFPCANWTFTVSVMGCRLNSLVSASTRHRRSVASVSKCGAM